MKKSYRIIISIFACLLFLSVLFYASLSSSSKQDDTPYQIINHYDEATKLEPITIRFNAVGDNLIHGAVYKDAKTGPNSYDFTPYYEHIKPYIDEADVSFINQETIVGGKELGLSHYPRFNSPEEVIEAIADTGFDLVNAASNHSLDKGEKGILNALNTFAQYPSLTVAGINSSIEEQNQLRIMESKGVTIGFLAYTYGTNGIPSPKGKEYLVNRIEEEKITKDVSEARENCDILIVSMHWGTEDSHTVNSMQQHYAKLLHNLGVDVIIGTHPHVIQKVDLLQSETQETLVIYSLGNFLSAQAKVKEMLELMMSWEIEYFPITNEIHITNIKAIPLINHFDTGYVNFKVYPLKDYTEALAKQHGLNFTKAEMIEKTKNILGNNFEIVLE